MKRDLDSVQKLSSVFDTTLLPPGDHCFICFSVVFSLLLLHKNVDIFLRYDLLNWNGFDDLPDYCVLNDHSISLDITTFA